MKKPPEQDQEGRGAIEADDSGRALDALERIWGAVEASGRPVPSDDEIDARIRDIRRDSMERHEDERPWSHLVKGIDAGGVRWFLDGQAVRCGTGLELRLPGGAFARVRFEMEGEEGVLYLATGVDPYQIDPDERQTSEHGPEFILRPAYGGPDLSKFHLRWPANHPRPLSK